MSRQRRIARIRALLSRSEDKRITLDEVMDKLAAQAAQPRKGEKA